ncbi:Tn3 family transposase [Streptomyces sp. NBC_01635]|uniref:Tn3 family transposase n=2 Tax=unclassified Streptomyces TaxID=2593676 RepID=UPI00386E62CF|nr:Tn3 family transposase [Streptomyces sp. NBC_01635]
MGRDLGLDGVVDHFALSGDEVGWLRNKSGATRLGFAVQLKFLTWRGRFPKMRLELPPDAVEHVAKQVGVTASELGFYDFTSRAAKRHRSELRNLTGWHECSVTDQVKLVSHLVDVIWHDERREEQVRAELLRQMRVDLIEPPTAAQIDSVIRSALHQADERAVAEVAAAIEGMMRHATTMQAEGNYVDSHGQSEIGFGLTRLLGYDLLPRIKQINKVKLYRPGREDEDTYERLADAMTRPIRWDVIENNYDQLIKYATAIRVGTASTEAILRRFIRTASHPVYQAMLEVGRAQKTIFVARYLRDRDLQREIQEGLNVVEGWNGANDIIFFGKSGELSSNRRDQQELSVLALHLLQTALVFVNTLMIQEMLADPEWANLLTEEDKRALTPLFWMHIQPYGEVRLNMGRRLQLAQPVHQEPDPEPEPAAA